MAEYRFNTRGAGLAEAIRDGLYSESYFSGLIDQCPETLVTDEQRRQLDYFLLHVPRLQARRTTKQRQQAQDLLELIRPLTKDVLVPEARELLLKRIAGETIRQAHRPANQTSHRLSDTMLLAKWIKQSVEACIREGQPLNVPRWGVVSEDPSWSQLPLAERSLRIARGALVARGFRPPADAALRNGMSKISDLRQLIVNAREEEQG
jgi:hypothetical protein